ncbi:Serine/arginine-rich splicing factor SC35 [Carex littledalei]|uniref:Serine/arginine-rich splicing factor SC35 n=1 Tax=Carex littledalei TaxID=544730 RepID=A0A833VEK5_9POAL|nr:Serine/arginine-rich splicing factor SC35 [Carex littledalei]
MSHFGRSGPPEIKDSYSLLVLNLTFRTSADDLYPLFDRYGEVVDIYIPRNRRTGDSRGFGFVRYKYFEDAHKAVDRLDGKMVDGRAMMVQFAKYGPNAERIHKGRVVEKMDKSKGRSRSRSPRRRDDYRDQDYRRRSRSRSRSRSPSPSRSRGRDRDRDYRRRSRSPSPSRSRSRSPVGDYKRRSKYSESPDRRSLSRSRSRSPPRKASPPPIRDASRSPPRSTSP